MTDKEWKVEVPEAILDELERSFRHGPIVYDNRPPLLLEHLIAHIGGLKVEIFSNEHPPPHFRVIYNGESANFSIRDCTKLNGKLDKWTRNIRKWHKNNKKALISTWNEHRPTDCPVGEYLE